MLSGFASNPYLRRCLAGYRRLFSIEEIENSTTVQWLFGALLLYFLVTFITWSNSSVLSTTNAGVTVCWPYFQHCGNLYFFTSLPLGYSQNIFYMVLFGIMLGATYGMWRKQWGLAHVCMAVLFAWKAFAGFFLSQDLLGVYDYYHLILTAVVLFFPLKEYFAKTAFVLLYFLSSTIKFYPTWVLGTYFTSLQTGLALFPDSLTPIITNLVIFSQTIGCWFLLSRHRSLQLSAFFFFEFFHFYSGVYVGYYYPLIAIPVLTILFGPMYRYQKPPLSRKSIAGWMCLVFLVALQLYTFIIPGDQKMTLEGYRYGVWMFDANHQCVATITEHYPLGTSGFRESTWEATPGSPCFGFSCLTKRSVQKVNNEWLVTERLESPKSWSRCSPYTVLMQYKGACALTKRIELQFDHSINGDPFYRIVDEQNICTLSYSPFWHNDWIKEAPDAPTVGYPVKNIYSSFGE